MSPEVVSGKHNGQGNGVWSRPALTESRPWHFLALTSSKLHDLLVSQFSHLQKGHSKGDPYVLIQNQKVSGFRNGKTVHVPYIK